MTALPRIVSPLYHVTTCMYYVYGLVYPRLYNLHMPGTEGFGGRFKYLTYLSFCLQAGYYMFAVIVDLHTTVKGYQCSKTKRIRDMWFSVFVFPLTVLVTLMFWGLYAVDRELVFPKFLDEHIPVTYNHMVHSFIVPLAVGEMLTTSIAPCPRGKSLKLLGFFALLYTAWSYLVSVKTGLWAYPILNKLSTIHRCLFFAFAYVLIILAYLITDTLQRIVSPTEKHNKKSE